MLFKYILLASLSIMVFGDGQFKSRPDLSPPKIHITHQVPEHVSGDLLFLTPRAPLSKSGEQPHEAQSAAYIFTPFGELVWSGYTYFGSPAFNFQAARYRTENVIYAFQGSFNPDYGHGHGWVRILNHKYQLVAEVRAGNIKLSDLHEFQITPDGTGLVEIYQPTQRDLTSSGGTSVNQRWVVDALFQGNYPVLSADCGNRY
jgi:Arylsulfotransferase (ASST)